MYINETYHNSLRNVHVAQTWIDQRTLLDINVYQEIT